MAATSNTLKSILGRAIRETGAALKESGNAEVGDVSVSLDAVGQVLAGCKGYWYLYLNISLTLLSLFLDLFSSPTSDAL
jgi:hypothetical protein